MGEKYDCRPFVTDTHTSTTLQRKTAVTAERVAAFMDKNRTIDPTMSKPGSTAHLQHEAVGRSTTVDSTHVAAGAKA